MQSLLDIFDHLYKNVEWWKDYLTSSAHERLHEEDIKHLTIDLETTIKRLKELS